MSNDIERRQDALTPQQQYPLEQLPAQPPAGFFTFRYTSTELFSQDGNLHMKRRETRYQDGRLTSEQCEGTLERQAYERMVNQAQAHFMQQLDGWLRLLYSPWSGRGR
jgi:hypothetical protein